MSRRGGECEGRGPVRGPGVAFGLLDSSTACLTVPANHALGFLSTALTGAAVGVPCYYAISTHDPDAGDVLSITVALRPAWLMFGDHGDGTATLAGTPGNAEVTIDLGCPPDISDNVPDDIFR